MLFDIVSQEEISVRRRDILTNFIENHAATSCESVEILKISHREHKFARQLKQKTRECECLRYFVFLCRVGVEKFDTDSFHRK